MDIAHDRPAFHWPSRGRAAGIHFLLSMALATAAALLVFLLWYPYPYREISGGRELFLIVVTVDVILGPLITLAIFDRRKPRRELVMDLSVVGLIQIAALCYGLWTVMLARPVHLVFEVDRFRVVHRADIDDQALAGAPAGLRDLPVAGPGLLAVRSFRNAGEQADATMAALGGVDLGAQPGLWEPYAAARPRVQAAAKPASELLRRFPDQKPAIEQALAGSGLAADKALFLPMIGRKSFWTVLLDPSSMEPVAFLPIDSF